MSTGKIVIGAVGVLGVLLINGAPILSLSDKDFVTTK
jgi:hypothetical protein